MDVDLPPFEEKVWNYIKDRKTPVTSAQMAKYFIVSQSKAAKAFSFLISKGLVTQTRMGNLMLYKAKND